MASLSGSDGSIKRVSVLRKEVDKDGKFLNPKIAQKTLTIRRDSLKQQNEDSDT